MGRFHGLSSMIIITACIFGRISSAMAYHPEWHDTIVNGINETTDSLTVEFINEQGSSALELGSGANKEAVDLLMQTLYSLNPEQIVSITISTGASPEGTIGLNKNLAAERASMIRNYMSFMTNLPDSLITYINDNVRWQELSDIMALSDESYAADVMSIANSRTNTSVSSEGGYWDSRLVRLKTLDGGRVYRKLMSEVFPHLRSTRVSIVWRVNKPDMRPVIPVDVQITPVGSADDDMSREPASDIPVPEISLIEPASDTMTVQPLTERHKHIAVKNNFVYDVALVANAGLEFGMGRHFSFDLPVTFSPYNIKENLKIRTLTFQPAFRWWFLSVHEGLFLEAYGHAGWYNVALCGKTRFQNSDSWADPFYGGGLGIGYSWPVGHSGRWNFEVNVGGGYAYLPSNHYYNLENGALFGSSVRNYWGLTRAGFSISYSLTKKE